MSASNLAKLASRYPTVKRFRRAQFPVKRYFLLTCPSTHAHGHTHTHTHAHTHTRSRTHAPDESVSVSACAVWRLCLCPDIDAQQHRETACTPLSAILSACECLPTGCMSEPLRELVRSSRLNSVCACLSRSATHDNRHCLTVYALVSLIVFVLLLRGPPRAFPEIAGSFRLAPAKI